MSSEATAAASSAATAAAAANPASGAAQLYLHNMGDNLKMLKRQLRGKDGRPGEAQLYMANVATKPNANLIFVVGDADLGRLARVVRAPSTYKGQDNSAYTISLALTGEDAEGAKALWQTIIAGMKEHRVLDPSMVTTPDIMKMVSFPIISETEDGAVFMTVTLGDDTEYLSKINNPKSKLHGRFKRITRDQIHKNDRVVVVIKLDRHREAPRHRFNRYAQRVFVIEQDKNASNSAGIIGSSGMQVEVVDYDSSLEDEEEEGGAAGAAAAADPAPAAATTKGTKRARPAAEEEEETPEDDNDAFEQAMQRARTSV